MKGKSSAPKCLTVRQSRSCARWMRSGDSLGLCIQWKFRLTAKSRINTSGQDRTIRGGRFCTQCGHNLEMIFSNCFELIYEKTFIGVECNGEKKEK